MIFSSLLFLFRFLPVVLLLYKITPGKYKNGFLFFASLFFYAWGEPVYVVLMLFSTFVDYYNGYMVGKYLDAGEKRKAKAMVALSVIINLGILGFFKYGDFFIRNINFIFHTHILSMNLALPIGISFYTFQTMSYTIDIYRRQAPRQKNIVDFGAYVALFPQLIAGPIVRYQTIADQLKGRRVTMDGFYSGILRFSQGLGKKVLLANNIGMLWDIIKGYPQESLSALMAWMGALAFGLQIYFDFSGYSDMAIGLGNMFGFQFPENFHYPYESESITEFWRRWHISLGTWFREYVYIPLGGNQKGYVRQIMNILAVWLLTGFWHGASWNFVLWGLYFGMLLMLEKGFLLKFMETWPALLKRGYTLFFVLVSWVIFAHDSLGEGILYLKAMLGLGNRVVDGKACYYLLNYGFVILILLIGATSIPARAAGRFMEKAAMGSGKLSGGIGAAATGCFVFGILFLSTAYLVDASYNPFLYFRF